MAGNTVVLTKTTRYAIEAFLETVNFADASFSPDGQQLLISSDANGIFNAYTISLTDGELIPVTHSQTSAIFIVDYFPRDGRFLYICDDDGNELTHVIVHTPDGGDSDLTPGEAVKANFLGWAKDDRSFFISTNERDPHCFDIYEISTDTYERTLLFQDERGYHFAAISPDGRYLAFSKTETNVDSNIYLYDRKRATMEMLTPHDGDIIHSPQAFSPDGRSLYFLTDEGSEFLYLACHELKTGRRNVVLQLNWDVLYAYFSRCGNYLITGINNNARTELRVYKAGTMARVSLPKLPDAEITCVTISPNGQRIAFYASGSRMPQDLFLYDLEKASVRQLTHSLSPHINPQDLVEGQIVSFVSYDGLTIPGILYKPHQASSQHKAPALVWVHGGPGGQSRIGYNALIQYLVNHGYVIFAINHRGSFGYGKTFFHLDDHRHGDADLDDCVYSKQMLIDTGYVDPERIGIIGGSYGGFIVLAALAFRPHAFTAGVDIFGISNWWRTLQSIPPWMESKRKALEAEMGPLDDEDYFRRISPLFHAEHIVNPLIVLQGANDPRVLQVESDEIVSAVRANGIPVEYLVFEDEGHGFMKRANQVRAYKAIRRFLERHL